MPLSTSWRTSRTKRKQKVSSISSANNSLASLYAGLPNATSSPSRDSTLMEKDPLDEFDDAVEEQMCNLRKRRDNLLESVDKMIRLIKLKFGDKVGNTPLGQFPCEVAESSKTKLQDAEAEKPKVVEHKSRRRSRSADHVLHSVFKKPAAKRISSRSCSTKGQTQASIKYKTPMNQGNRPNLSAFTVTPKMNPNTPISVLRMPRQGEVAISMTGSPLMVSAVRNDEMPSVQVPLGNGTVLSLLPRQGFNREDIPDVDEITRSHLHTLFSHLQEFLQ